MVNRGSDELLMSRSEVKGHILILTFDIESYFSTELFQSDTHHL